MRRRVGGSMPPEKDFFKTAQASYSETPPQSLDGFTLIASTPTLKVYLKDKTILAGVRGTKVTDKQDLLADARIPLNLLKYSDRYKRDKEAFDKIVKQYPPQDYEYYISGHSLGGAIDNQLKYDYPFIKNAVEYNPAFQPKDFFYSQGNDIKRLYTDKDALYNLGGKLFTNKQVIPAKSSLGNSYIDGISGHILSNFAELYNVSGGADEDLRRQIIERARRGREAVRNRIPEDLRPPPIIIPLRQVEEPRPNSPLRPPTPEPVIQNDDRTIVDEGRQSRSSSMSSGFSVAEGGSRNAGFIKRLIASGDIQKIKVKKPSKNLRDKIFEYHHQQETKKYETQKKQTATTRDQSLSEVLVANKLPSLSQLNFWGSTGDKFYYPPYQFNGRHYYVKVKPSYKSKDLIQVELREDSPNSHHPALEDHYTLKEFKDVVKGYKKQDSWKFISRSSAWKGRGDGGSKNAGFIKMLYAKRVLKRKPEDYPTRDKKAPKLFQVKKIKKPSAHLRKKFGVNETIQRVSVNTLNRPFKKGERKHLSPEHLAELRSLERERKHKSLAKKEGVSLEEYYRRHPRVKR